MTTVILLEDDPLLAIVQKKMLTSLGYELIGSLTTGEEGLEKIKSLNPDIIICDQNLKGEMKGLDVIKLLRDEKNDTPVLILSGDTTHDFLKQASLYSNVQTLAKPVKVEELKNTLLIAAEQYANF